MSLKRGDVLIVICIYNSICRFAVPCFLMTSGAFILDNDNNSNYKLFYRKSFQKLGIPLLIFSIFYIMYDLLTMIVMHNINFKYFFIKILTGAPMYHMWYMYMIIGIYIFAPFVIKIKDIITEQNFVKVVIIFLLSHL